MWESIGDFIGRIGLPGFIAIYVLMGLKPEIRKLRQTIETQTVVTAKANGMSAKTVREIVELVASHSWKRLASDRVDFPDDDEET